jgi:hypothetical protein
MVMTEVMGRVKAEFDFEAEANTQDAVHEMLSKVSKRMKYCRK